MTDYIKQAEEFLRATDTTFSIVFLYTGPDFPDDKKLRDVFQFTLKNARGIYSAKFGDSTHNTINRLLAKHSSPFGCRLVPTQDLFEHTGTKNAVKFNEWCKKNYKALRTTSAAPSAYDVLACLTKNDPGTFRDFCGDFGYDADSKKAEKVYFAVQEEWDGVRSLFTTEQLSALQEIN